MVRIQATMNQRAPLRARPGRGCRLILVASLLALAADQSAAQAAPKASRRAKAASPAAGSTPQADTLELVGLDDMQLERPSRPTRASRKASPQAAPTDSLDALLNRSGYTEAKDPETMKERMRFPGEQRKEPAPAPSKEAVEAPDRITSDVTAKAMADAKADADKQARVVPASATVPKLPAKLTVGDDPLSGMLAKDIEGKGHKPRKKPEKGVGDRGKK